MNGLRFLVERIACLLLNYGQSQRRMSRRELRLAANVVDVCAISSPESLG